MRENTKVTGVATVGNVVSDLSKLKNPPMPILPSLFAVNCTRDPLKTPAFLACQAILSPSHAPLKTVHFCSIS